MPPDLSSPFHHLVHGVTKVEKKVLAWLERCLPSLTGDGYFCVGLDEYTLLAIRHSPSAFSSRK